MQSIHLGQAPYPGQAATYALAAALLTGMLVSHLLVLGFGSGANFTETQTDLSALRTT